MMRVPRAYPCDVRVSINGSVVTECLTCLAALSHVQRTATSRDDEVIHFRSHAYLSLFRMCIDTAKGRVAQFHLPCSLPGLCLEPRLQPTIDRGGRHAERSKANPG